MSDVTLPTSAIRESLRRGLRTRPAPERSNISQQVHQIAVDATHGLDPLAAAAALQLYANGIVVALKQLAHLARCSQCAAQAETFADGEVGYLRAIAEGIQQTADDTTFAGIMDDARPILDSYVSRFGVVDIELCEEAGVDPFEGCYDEDDDDLDAEMLAAIEELDQRNRPADD